MKAVMILVLSALLASTSLAKQACRLYSKDITQGAQGAGRFGNTLYTNDALEYFSFTKKILENKGYQFVNSRAQADVEIHNIVVGYQEQEMCVAGSISMQDLKTGEEGFFSESKCGILSALFEVGEKSALRQALRKVPACN